MVKQTDMSDRALRQGVERSESDWHGAQGALGEYILAESEKTLEAYSNQPNLVLEHAYHEEDTALRRLSKHTVTSPIWFWNMPITRRILHVEDMQHANCWS